MKLACGCGFDTEDFNNIADVKADLQKKSVNNKSWYVDDFENRCPHCAENGLRLVED